MSAKFSVQSFPLPARAADVVQVGGNGAAVGPVPGPVVGVGPTMEIETRMKLVGRVRVLKVFTHKVESGISCGVAIQVSTGSVLGFHC